MLRATLKSLLSRKLRLVLSAMSVVLAVMFVSGAFVLSDTLGRTFDSLFTSVYDYVDIQLEAKPKLAENGDVAALAAPIPAATVGQVEGVPGVRKATGQVFADGQIVDEIRKPTADLVLDKLKSLDVTSAPVEAGSV